MLTSQDESDMSGLFEPTDTLTEMFTDVMLDTLSETFMEILKGKPEEFYWKLLRALRKSGHDHVVPMLEGPGKYCILLRFSIIISFILYFSIIL